jgi:tetratricopeptide (TPR) repeat protein
LYFQPKQNFRQALMGTAGRLGLFIALLASVGCNPSPEQKEAKYLKRGDTLVSKKDYARAVLEYRTAIQAKPKDAEPYYRMGLAYIAMRDLANGARALRTATNLDPKHTGAQLKLAELLTATGDTKLIQEAASRIQTAFGPSPVDPAAIDALASVDWKLGKPEDAFQRLHKLLKKSPSHLQSSLALARMKLSRNDGNGAEEVLKQAAAAAPQSFDAALALGEFYVSLRQTAKAEPEVRRALRLDPKRGTALMSLGRILIAEKRLGEAEQTYKQLAALPEKEYRPLYAVFLYQVNRRDAALSEFQKLAQSDPIDRNTRSLLVSVYVKMNKLSEAENVLTAALKRNPKDNEALLERGELYLKLGKASDSEKDLNGFLRFNPDSAEAHFALAGVYKIQGRERNQRQELSRALQLDPDLIAVRLATARSFRAAHQPKSALEVLDQAPSNQKGLSPVVVERNWALLELGNLEEAKAGIDRVLHSVKMPEVVLQRAFVKLLEHDYAGARDDAEESLKGNPDDIRAVSVIAEAYASQKQLPKAIERLRELAAARPKSAPLQNLLGQWYLRSDNPGAARKAFEAAKSADSRFVPADLALAQLDLREGRNDSVRQRMSAVLVADQKNVPALLLLAGAEEHAGDRAAALGTYRRVLNVDGSSLIALNNIAYSLALDNPDEALKFAQQAAEIAPDNPTIEDTLGWVYYRKGLYSMAVRYLKTATEKETTPLRQFHLGMSYTKAGDPEMGLKMMSAALEKDPNLAKSKQGW